MGVRRVSSSSGSALGRAAPGTSLPLLERLPALGLWSPGEGDGWAGCLFLPPSSWMPTAVPVTQGLAELCQSLSASYCHFQGQGTLGLHGQKS